MADDYLGEPGRPSNVGSMNSKDIQKMIMAVEDSDSKGGGIVSLVKEGKVMHTWGSVYCNNNVIRYYDYYTCEELIDYKPSD